jgi:hypothetical protein
LVPAAAADDGDDDGGIPWARAPSAMRRLWLATAASARSAGCVDDSVTKSHRSASRRFSAEARSNDVNRGSDPSSAATDASADDDDGDDDDDDDACGAAEPRGALSIMRRRGAYLGN